MPLPRGAKKHADLDHEGLCLAAMKASMGEACAPCTKSSVSKLEVCSTETVMSLRGKSARVRTRFALAPYC